MSNGLALLGDLESSGALTTTGLNLPTTIGEDEYEALGALLGRMHEAMRWAIGDYIIQGEALFGERVYQLCEALGISEESKQQYIRVALAIPLPRRRPDLTWSHHRVVYARPPQEQDEWLAAAEEHRWTLAELGEHIYGESRDRKRASLQAVYDAALNLFDGSSWNGSEFVVTVGLMAELGDALGREHPSEAYVG